MRRLTAEDIGPITDAFAELGWAGKTPGLYRSYLAQQQAGERVVWVEHQDGEFAGYICVVADSDYPPFRQAGIPEIVDLNVLPRFRRRGIGAALLRAAERSAAEHSPVVGIGVGISPDYGSAFRLYVRHGYQPDGRGVAYGGVNVSPGAVIRVDDSAALYLTREIRP